MFLHSTFAPAELAKEQKVVLEEIRMYDDAPDDMIHDLFVRTMWSGSNLGEPTIGYANTVSSLSRDDLREHMRRSVLPKSRRVLGRGKRGSRCTRRARGTGVRRLRRPCRFARARAPDADAGTSFVKTKDTEQAYVVLGTQGLSVRDERRYQLSVLDTILGGGMSSRLFQEVREKRGPRV